MVSRGIPGLRHGYLHAGSKAIKQCLVKAGIALDEVGMLINSGVYPDKHIQEPAFASMLQGKQYSKRVPDTGRTFSFDLHIGGGSLLMAFRIITGFIESGKIGKGMVVAGDAEPLRGQSSGYFFSDEAVAILLEKGRSGEGFVGFCHGSFPANIHEYSSVTDYGSEGLYLHIKQKDIFLESCLSHSGELIGDFLKKEDLTLEEIDLVIPSQHPVDFARGLTRFFPEEKLVILDGDEILYSAGPGIALENALSDQRFKEAAYILFISAGAGISVNLALYRHPR